jgi:protein transport protein SEC24
LYYPGFRSDTHGEKFQAELRHDLLRETGWEAVLRARVTEGYKIVQYHGAFAVRNQGQPDLMVLPTVDCDKCVSIDIVVDEKKAIRSQQAVVQIALLYSTSFGERRIRVLTLVAPVVDAPLQLWSKINVAPLVAALSRRAILSINTQSISKVRARVKSTVFAILSAAARCSTDNKTARDRMASLPTMALALLKSKLLRAGTDIRIDERSFLHHWAMTVDQSTVEAFLYPRLFVVHPLDPAAGVKDAEGTVSLPQEQSLSMAGLSSESVYLVDNGMEFYLRVGSQVDPNWLHSMGLDAKTAQLHEQTDGDLTSEYARLRTICTYLRKLSFSFQRLQVVMEGSPDDRKFAELLFEDSSAHQKSFAEFAQEIAAQTGFY